MTDDSVSDASPTGYLFTDIEDSTVHWELRPGAMRATLERHNQILDTVIADHEGLVVNDTGDGVFAVFPTGNALSAGLDIQRAIQAEGFADPPLRIRIGVHAGVVPSGAPDFNGSLANRAARVMSTAWGGQVVASDIAASYYQRPGGARLENLGTHLLKGVQEPIRIYGLTHPDLDTNEFPPLRSISTERQHLPGDGAPFFGRTEELATIAELLTHPDTRTVTIVGPGGYGKTRLATRLAELQQGLHPFGSHFISLESARSSSEAVSAIANALDLGLYGAKPEAEQLVDFLRNKRGLIILDNAELVAHDAGFAQMLAEECPGLRVLVTSRMPLGTLHERVVRIEGLGPQPETGRAAQSSPAYRLFEHHARISAPDFELTDDDAQLFAELHDLVAGSPLALELAARWCRVSPLATIVSEIRENLDFLNTEDSELPERHRGSRAVFDYSWALMSDDDRSVLAKMGIFVGSFGYEAAARVADLTLIQLARLEAQSLVVRAAENRFELHPLIRQYVLQQLTSMGDVAVGVRRAHSDYYLGMIPVRVTDVCGEQEHDVTVSVAREMRNVRVAWDHCIDDARWADIRERIEPLFHVLSLRGRYAEANAWFSRALEHVVDDDVRALLLAVIGSCTIQQGDHDRARASAVECLDISDAGVAAKSLAELTMGNRAHARGELDGAQGHYERALSGYESIDHGVGQYFTLASMALVRLRVDDAVGADRLVRRGRRVASRLRFVSGMMAAFLIAGDIARHGGDLDRALDCYERALGLHDGVTDPQMRVSMMRRLGSLSAAKGDLQLATQRHREAHSLACDIGDRRQEAEALLDLGVDHLEAGDPAGATDDMTDALELAQTLDMAPVVTRALVQIARSKEISDDLGWAGRIVAALPAATAEEFDTELAAIRARLDDLDDPVDLDLEDVIDDLVAERRYGALPA